MSKVVNIKEKPAFEDGVRVITNPEAKPETGGKEPPFGDFLTPMTKYTRFLVKPRKGMYRNWAREEFMVWDHAKYHVQVMWMTLNETLDWADPKVFCDHYELSEVIEIGEEEVGYE